MSCMHCSTVFYGHSVGYLPLSMYTASNALKHSALHHMMYCGVLIYGRLQPRIVYFIAKHFFFAEKKPYPTYPHCLWLPETFVLTDTMNEIMFRDACSLPLSPERNSWQNI